MSGNRSRRLAAAVMLVVTSMRVGSATASGGSDEAAQQAFREGVEAARQARWPEARILFERAHSLSPRPVVLINLAGAQARTGRLIEAAKNYHRILDDSTSAETAPFRKAAAEVLPSLEERIPKVRVRPLGNSTADSFEIDGEPVAVDRLRVGQPLDPGEHTLLVRRAEIEQARVLFSLGERETREIPLTLPSLVLTPKLPLTSTTEPQAPMITSGNNSTDTAQPERRWWASPWTWVAVGVVVAASSAAVFLAVDRRSDPYSGNVPPGRVILR